MRERLKHDVFPNLPAAPKGKVIFTGLADLADFVANAEPEFAGNAMLCAVNQASYLLRRQVQSQSRDFKEHERPGRAIRHPRVSSLWQTHEPPHRWQDLLSVLWLLSLPQLQRHPRNRTLKRHAPHREVNVEVRFTISPSG